MPGKELQKKSATDTVKDMLLKYRQDFAAVLPRTISPERLARVVTTTMRKNPELLKCSPASILGCVMEASILGLEPDCQLGHAYLVPFRNSKTRTTECQLIPGYRGYIKLAKQSGDVEGIFADVVWSCDKFSVERGTDPKIVHVPNDIGRQEEGAKAIGAYAVATFPSGARQFEWVPADEVEKIKKRSMAGSRGFGPWSHPDDVWMMWRKTAVRRLCKYLALTPVMDKAVGLDDQHEAGLSQNMAQVLTEDQYQVSDDVDEKSEEETSVSEELDAALDD